MAGKIGRPGQSFLPIYDGQTFLPVLPIDKLIFASLFHAQLK
jgi:hypothetical protein